MYNTSGPAKGATPLSSVTLSLTDPNFDALQRRHTNTMRSLTLHTVTLSRILDGYTLVELITAFDAVEWFLYQTRLIWMT